MFYDHVIEELEFKNVSQKESNWETDLTVKRMFESI